VAVGEVQEADGLALRVEAHDVEVLRVHQAADDLVQARQHLGGAVVGTGDVGDREQRALQALGAGQALDVDLQALGVAAATGSAATAARI
jgi:hypothetical protein